VRAFLVVLIVGGCVEARSTSCADGRVCPAGEQCTPTGDACGTIEQIQACLGQAEDDQCILMGAGRGYCASGVCTAPICGNMIVEPGEACDDGNTRSGDGCSGDCKKLEVCGDGVRDPQEGCDCGTDPANLPANCTEPNSIDKDAECRPNCELPGCGDGVIAGLEDCEPTLALTDTCQTLEFYSGTLKCGSNCRYDLTSCVGRCGDGVINGDEQCDKDQIGTETCQDLGYYEGTPGCTKVTCRYDTSTCSGRCGDGTVDTQYDELCDVGHPVPFSCLDYGFDAGYVGCALCQADFQTCKHVGWEPFPGVPGVVALFSWPGATVAYGAYPDSIVVYDGNTWTTSFASPGFAFEKIWGVGPSNLYAVGVGGVKHFDGSTWQTPSWATGLTGLHSVWGTTSPTTQDVWLAGANVWHWDGTTLTSSAPGATYLDVWASAPDDAIAVGTQSGTDGVLAHWNGTSWTSQTYPRRLLTGVWGSTTNYAWTVGANGPAHWNGATLRDQPTATALGSFQSILGVSATEMYATGGGGVYRWDGTVWSPMRTPDGETINAVAWYGGDMLAAGKKATYRYHGSAWAPAVAAPAATLHAISGTGPDDLVAVGDAGTILGWDGSGWRAQASSVDVDLVGVWADAPNDRWAAGGEVILHDAGSGWTIAQRSFTSYSSVWASGPTNVYVVSGGNQLQHLTGGSWTTELSSTPIETVWGSSAMDVFAAGGDVHRWDGGSWTDLALTGVHAIGGTGPTDLWAAAAGEVLRSTDDGASWTPVVADGADYSRVVADGAGQAWFLRNGVVAHFDGVSWDPNTSRWSGNALYSLRPGDAAVAADAQSIAIASVGALASTLIGQDFSEGIWASGPDDIWLADEYGVAHDDGTRLSHYSFGGDDDKYGVWSDAPGDAFVAGRDGVYRVTAGVPTLVYPYGGGALEAVWGADASHVVAVGTELATWDGASWTPQTGFPELQAITGTSATDMFAVGAAGTIVHFDGVSWSAQTSNTTAFLRAVWAAAPDDVYAVGDAGTVVHYDGSTWSVEDPGTKLDLRAVAGSSGGDVFVLGAQAGLLHRDGTTGYWSPVNEPIAGSMMAAAGGDVLIADRFSTIWRLVRTTPW
jgi:cysteine-rich repeat protein